jgi:hypothetical protein
LGYKLKMDGWKDIEAKSPMQYVIEKIKEAYSHNYHKEFSGRTFESFPFEFTVIHITNQLAFEDEEHYACWFAKNMKYMILHETPSTLYFVSFTTEYDQVWIALGVR